MSSSNVRVITKTLKNTLKCEETILLTYEINYPCLIFDSSNTQINKINSFYKAKAIEYANYCENTLFNLAVQQYLFDKENDYPVRIFDVVQDFEVTLLADCIFSLYLDRYEYTGGAHGNTNRCSATWNLKCSQIISLSDLVACLPDCRTFIINEVQQQIEADPSFYFEDYPELIRKTFNSQSFYCTNEGIVVYYQKYDIAPYASGIRTFLIPYSDCVKNPELLCFWTIN